MEQVEDTGKLRQKHEDKERLSPSLFNSPGQSNTTSGNSSDSSGHAGGSSNNSSDEIETKKSTDSGGSGGECSSSSSNKDTSSTSSNRSSRRSRRRVRGHEAEIGHDAYSKMPRPTLEKKHPRWDCKREGCTGKLTLIGRVETHFVDLENAKARARQKRKEYPATHLHGSLLSCNRCGDRPKHGSRHATWQRLCEICGEPYAMNGFWRKHGGCNKKKLESALELRAPLHKKKLRSSHWNAKSIASLDVTLAAEKKFLILAYKNMIQSATCDISDDVIDKFEGTYETYTKEEYRSSVKKEQNDDETASIVSSTYSNTSDLISIANSPIHKTTTKTTEVFLVKHEQQQKQRTKKSTKIRRRARNRVQLEPGEIPTTHPLMACKREGCAGNMTLLGDVKNHAETLEECQERAKLKFKLYPQTFFHGSSMTCMECGDRPRVGTHGRNASWQRLCRICGEAYAMNGFWRSHGGHNNQNITSPLHMRSSIHKSNLRKEWKYEAIESLDKCLNAEKAWLRIALKDTNFRLRGEIKDVDLITNKMGRVSTSNIVTAPKRRRSLSGDAVVMSSNTSSALKRGNFMLNNGVGTQEEMRLAGESLAMLSKGSLSTSSTPDDSSISSSSSSSRTQPSAVVSARSQMSVPQLLTPCTQQQQAKPAAWHAGDFLPVLGHFVQIYHSNDWYRACIAKLEGAFVYFFLPSLGITKKVALPNDTLVLRPDFGFAMTQQQGQSPYGAPSQERDPQI